MWIFKVNIRKRLDLSILWDKVHNIDILQICDDIFITVTYLLALEINRFLYNIFLLYTYFKN